MSLLLPLDEMLLLLAAWALVALAHSGWGFLLFRPWRITPTFSGAFWVGTGAVVTLLQLWSLPFPVGSGAPFVVVIVGIAGRALAWKTRRFALARPRWSPLWLLPAVLLALLVANHALRPPVVYDNGLYHLQAIAWARDYPAVPGLANLHGRLAFNSGYFLLAALWDDALHSFSGAQLLNGLLTLALASDGFRALAAVFDTRRLTPPALLSILLLLPLVTLLFDPLAHYLSGPTTDYVVWLLSLRLGAVAFHELYDHGADPARPLEVIVLAWTLVTFKLSGALFGLATLALILHAAWRRARTPPKRLLVLTTLTAALLVLPWMTRTAVMSGYLVYPATVGALPVDWRVSDAQALDDASYVRSWARYPVPGSHWRDVLGNWAWFDSWKVNFWRTRGIRLSLLLAALGWGAAGLLALWSRGLPRGARVALLWSLPPAASLLVWFLAAPDPRFALAYFWLVALGGIVAFYSSIPALPAAVTRAARHPAAEFAAALLVALFILFSHGPGWQNDLTPVPKANLSRYRTASGLEIYLPESGELCWDAVLLCTPYPVPTLRLREPGNIAAGFTIRP